MIDDLPQEIHERISDWLVAPDVISYTTTCKKIHAGLDLATMTDSYSYFDKVKSREHWIGEYHDRERVWFDFFPNILSGKDCIHSIRFDCVFVDQGWGNRKSYLCIREHDVKDGKNLTNSTASGDVIARSHIAEHHETLVRFQFRPKPGKQYSTCFYVGGGGGHHLYVSNVQIRYLMYHNDGRAQASKLLRGCSSNL